MSAARLIVLMREKPGVAWHAWCHGSKASCTSDAETAARRVAANVARVMLERGELARVVREEDITFDEQRGSSWWAVLPAWAFEKPRAGVLRCIYCGFDCHPSGFGSHCCKQAPDCAEKPKFKTSQSRNLTLAEIQLCRLASGLKPSPRIARELCQGKAVAS